MSPSVPGLPGERRLQFGCQVYVNRRHRQVPKRVDEYGYVCVVIFYFFIICSIALKSHFPIL